MLGLAPLAAAPLSDDGDRLPRITAGAIGEVALSGSAAVETIAGGRSKAATLAVGGAIAGGGDIHAYGADDINVAGNAPAIGRIIGEAAGSFAATTTAAIALRSAASIHGDIGLSGQSAGRVESAGAAHRLWDLEGVSVARSSLIASGSGIWGPIGAARGTVSTQSSVAGSFAVARRFEAGSAITGATVRGFALEGVSQGAIQSAGASDSILGLDAVVRAKVAPTVTLANELRLTGYATADATSSARAQMLGPEFAGQALGTTLKTRFAAMVGQIGISVSARSVVQTTAIADTSVAASLDARGNMNTRIAIAGALPFARELNADVLASGQAGRQIGLRGAASGITETAADAAVVGLKVTGASEARSGNLATMRHELSASGKTELASAVSGAVIGIADWAGASDAITGTRAVAETEASLQGESFSATSTNADATNDLAVVGGGAGDARPVAQVRGKIAVAGGVTGTVSSFGLGRGVFDVARSFWGDVDVFGNSARAIGLAGQTTVNSAAIGTVTTAGFFLRGSATATGIGRSKAAAQVPLSGETNGPVQSTAFVQHRFEIGLFIKGASPRTAESNVTWAAEGHADGKLALIGTAGDGLAIASDAAARATLSARASGALALTGETTTSLEAHADAVGVLAIRRDSDAAVEIDGDAHRSISIHGSCQGRASITAKLRPLHLTLTLASGAENAAHGRASSEVTAAGAGIAQVQAQAASQARLAISRTGAADVLILGAAWRGIAFLGASEARLTALAAANSSVMPSLAAAAANVIHLDLKAEAIAPGGQAAGSNLACAQDVSAQWDLDITAIAFRAPPALGRSEPVRLGLSGRLVPTNTGRILRG